MKVSKLGINSLTGQGKCTEYCFNICFLANDLFNFAHFPRFHRTFTGSIVQWPQPPHRRNAGPARKRKKVRVLRSQSFNNLQQSATPGIEAFVSVPPVFPALHPAIRDSVQNDSHCDAGSRPSAGRVSSCCNGPESRINESKAPQNSCFSKAVRPLRTRPS